MMPTQQTVKVIIFDGNKVLLYLRKNTWFENGKYSVPGGNVDSGEGLLEAAVREVKEETGLSVSLSEENHVFQDEAPEPNGDRYFENHYYVTRSFSGDAQNLEPDQCGEVRWFPVTDLPSNTSELVRAIIEEHA